MSNSGIQDFFQHNLFHIMKKQVLSLESLNVLITKTVKLGAACSLFAISSCTDTISEARVRGGDLNFSIQKPIQNSQTILEIRQTPESGLSISATNNGSTSPIPSHMIAGLPKSDLLPKSFFDSSYVREANGEVRFSLQLKGGGKKETESLLKALRVNLTNDYDEELSEKDINILLDVFAKMIELKQEDGANPEELQAFVTKELGKYENREELGKAFNYLLTRAEGKYGFFSFMFFGVAKLIFSWFVW